MKNLTEITGPLTKHGPLLSKGLWELHNFQVLGAVLCCWKNKKATFSSREGSLSPYLAFFSPACCKIHTSHIKVACFCSSFASQLLFFSQGALTPWTRVSCSPSLYVFPEFLQFPTLHFYFLLNVGRLQQTLSSRVFGLLVSVASPVLSTVLGR